MSFRICIFRCEYACFAGNIRLFSLRKSGFPRQPAGGGDAFAEVRAVVRPQPLVRPAHGADLAHAPVLDGIHVAPEPGVDLRSQLFNSDSKQIFFLIVRVQNFFFQGCRTIWPHESIDQLAADQLAKRFAKMICRFFALN